MNHNPPSIWQPIALAPKDGSYIDIFTKEGIRLTNICWDSVENSWQACTDEGDLWSINSPPSWMYWRRPYEATHWMLIPAPPMKA